MAVMCHAKGGFFRSVLHSAVDSAVNTTVNNVLQPQQQTQPEQAQQQPAAQPQPTAQPVSAPQPAAVPAAPAPAVPAVDASAFAGARTTSANTAEPEYSYGRIEFTKCATPEQIAAARAKMAADKRDPDSAKLIFRVDKKVDPTGPDYATLAAACAKFPEAQTVQIDECPGITSIAPLALMANATRIKVSNFKNLDLSPLSGLVNLELLEFTYSEIADLSPIGALPRLKKVDFYGAVLNDFTPLAGCPMLDEVYFYAAKLPPEKYATLGSLKQVKKFHGGLTKMTSIAWLAQVPQAEELVIFAEKIADLSPLAGAVNLKYLRVWNFDGGSMAPALGDLSLLANLKNLEKLELPGSSYSNLAALGGLAKLKKLDLSNAKAPLDLAFARSLPALENLDVSSPAGPVANFEALFGHPALKDVNLRKAGSVKSIAGLAQCPALKSATVSKGVFPAEEVAALNAALQARGKYNKVREY